MVKARDRVVRHLRQSVAALNKTLQDLPVPSAGILFPPGSPITELSDSLFKGSMIQIRSPATTIGIEVS